MGVDAIVAFPVGRLYNVVKFRSLYIAPIATLATVALLATRNATLAYVVAILWDYSRYIRNYYESFHSRYS